MSVPEWFPHWWWISLFTVPALAWVIKLAHDRARKSVALRPAVRAKLGTFTESGPGYWVVTATLENGRIVSQVCITTAFRFPPDHRAGFRIGDIADVAWEGRVEAPPPEPVPLS